MGKDLVSRALAFAVIQHRHQYRRDGVTAYVEHPKAVMSILRDELGVTDPEVLAAALLHDTIEDTNTDYDEVAGRFGRRVGNLVAALTKDKRLPETRREREYFAQLRRATREAKLCKIADTLHNLRDADALHRPKTLRKARELLKAFRGSPGLGRATQILREEMLP
jgi:guanosine-3',5'-bis(diphosphate) 3'-pyrophosphohydrolase